MADNGYLPASTLVPIVQWIECRLPEPKMGVRILLGTEVLAGGECRLPEPEIGVLRQRRISLWLRILLGAPSALTNCKF